MFSTIRTYWIDILIAAQGLIIIYMMVWLFMAGWLQII
jgi:hypothetical protein